MPAGQRNRTIAIVAGAIAVLLAAYAAFGFLLAPRIVEHKLAALVEQRLGQQLSMDALRINPFAMSVEVSGLRLGSRTGTPVVAARRFYLDLAVLRSVFGRGWVLGDAQCDGLQVLVEMQKNGRLNMADLAAQWARTAGPAEPPKAPPRVTIDNLLVADSALTYRDLTGTAASTQLLPIRIQLQNVSTVPDREGRYNVAARLVDGASLSWHGDLSLQPLQSEGDMELQGLMLATIWKFVQDDLRIQEPKGRLTAAAHYKFGYENGRPEIVASKLRVHASGLDVKPAGARESLLALKSLEVRDGRLQLGRRTLDLPIVALADGHLNLARDTNGEWNWGGMARPRREGSPRPAPEKSPQEPWHVGIASLTLQNVLARLNDWQHPAPLSLQAQVDGRTAVSIDAGASLDLHLTDADLHLAKLRMPQRDDPGIEIGVVRLQGGYLDLARRELGAKLLAVEDGRVRIERGADGTLPLARMFASAGSPADDAAAASPARPWRYALDAARVQRMEVSLVDRPSGKAAAWQVKGVTANATKLASDAREPFTFDLAATIASGGTLKASGTALPDFSRADAVVKIGAFALAPLQPIIAQHAALTLVSGNASATATIAYRRGEQPSLTARGPFDFSDVRFNEAGNDQRLVEWKKLSSGDARFALEPMRIRVKEIVIDQPGLKVDIDEQRRLNLMRLGKHEADPAPPPARPGAAKPMSIHVGEVRVRDGTVDYADRSLVLPFAARVTNFAGSAASLSTDRDRHANLQFEGLIGEFGAAKVAGSLDAFAPKSFTDVHADFENVEMSQLSPYTATFLGRKIASGKLWLNLEYKIEEGELAGDNKVTIHQLALGEPVEAPGVRRLPLDLAVALLTDSEGVIRTAVPVKGNVNDPKFAIGTVIREALGNLIARIASAPFRALAGLFGGKGGDKDAGAVAFEPGSAVVMPAEREKLQTVARILGERPQLKLVVQAPYSPQADREAIQRDKAARDVAAELGRSLEAGEKPGPLAYENVGTQRAIERAFSSRATTAMTAALVAQYTRENGHEPKRVGMVLRSPGEPDFYKAMFEALALTETVTDEALHQLADSRASAVVDLLEAGGADASRVTAGPAQERKAGEKKNVIAELSLQAGAPREVSLR